MKQSISIVGIGPGSREGMTIEALRAVESCDLLIGAKRMADCFADLGKPVYLSYQPEEIGAYLTAHPEYTRPAVVLSGDVGFYSGAKKLYACLPADSDVQTYCGVSSLVLLCGRLRTPWEDVHCVSVHGRENHLVNAVCYHPKTFLLAGGNPAPEEICKLLCQAGLGQVTVSVGENLSYPEEKVTTGTAEQLQNSRFDKLSVLLVENPGFTQTESAAGGIGDDAFLRGKVPMTKSEVRTVSLSKLQIRAEDIIYDIGAGTGSVAVEAALLAKQGQVYAIERKQEAAELILQNREKFGAYNLTLVEGLAPEALDGLPAPDKAFLGGTAGNMDQIFRALLEKNPAVRIVVNVIALESLSEAICCFQKYGFQDVDIAQVTVAKSKTAGNYHMMTGQNPVYIISGEGVN